jgi:hydrogenase expression/formation protein HypC
MHPTTPAPASAGPARLILPPGDAAGPACSDTCVTCGDVAVAVRVVELLPRELATVDTGAGLEQVSVALVSARVGDMILVHAGEALTVLADHDPPDGGDRAPRPAEG